MNIVWPIMGLVVGVCLQAIVSIDGVVPPVVSPSASAEVGRGYFSSYFASYTVKEHGEKPLVSLFKLPEKALLASTKDTPSSIEAQMKDAKSAIGNGEPENSDCISQGSKPMPQDLFVRWFLSKEPTLADLERVPKNASLVRIARARIVPPILIALPRIGPPIFEGVKLNFIEILKGPPKKIEQENEYYTPRSCYKSYMRSLLPDLPKHLAETYYVVLFDISNKPFIMDFPASLAEADSWLQQKDAP